MAKSIQSKNNSGRLIINRLAAVLKEEGIMNKELAKMLDYEETTVSQWATNTTQPTNTTMLRIALLIDRDLKDFFVSTKDMEEAEKKKHLKVLAEVAAKSKRTGKSRSMHR
jgi:transcriptional regulator with XRE-family HTH domain